MKIEIDTERDSERELRAALRLLQELLGSGLRSVRVSPAYGPAAGASTAGAPSQPSTGMFSMFDTPPAGEDAGRGQGTSDEERDIYPDDELRIEPY